jgi:hypothetical protein
MGSGAQKNFDVIPTETMVTILAAEGLVQEAFTNLAKALGKVFEGEDNWNEVKRWRELMFSRTKILTQAIMRLERSQDNV